MQTERTNLFMREDTFFGVCQGIQEDLRIPADLLRIGFAGLLYINMTAAFALYGALAVVVLSSRLIFPNVRRPSRAARRALARQQAAREESIQEEATEEMVANEPEPLPVAA